MTDVQQEQFWIAVRQILAALGGYLIGAKLIPADTWNNLLGAVMTILPIALGLWVHAKAEAKTQAREAVAVNVGIAVADRTPGVTAPIPAANAAAVIKAFAPVTPAVPLVESGATGLAVSPNSPIVASKQP